MAQEEKLKEAKRLYETANADQRYVLEKLFPELKEKESEDERIKKTISDILLIDSDEIREILDANNVLMQDVDAWLEKQGEQKPTFVNNFRTWLYIVADVLTEFNGIGQYLDNSDCREMAERLREKYCFDDTSSDWQKVYQKGLKVGEIYGRNKAKKEQEQKLVEWSEEDERIYRSITYSFAHNFPLTIQQQEFIKSLKDRYTWKPSDEQMTQLGKYCPDNRTLTSLYEQLKKLKGE